MTKASGKAGPRRGLTSWAQRSSAARPPCLRSEPQRRSSSRTRGRQRSLQSERPEPSPSYSQLTGALGDRGRQGSSTNSRAVLASGTGRQGWCPKRSAGQGGSCTCPELTPASAPRTEVPQLCYRSSSFPLGWTRSALRAQTAGATSRVFTPR